MEFGEQSITSRLYVEKTLFCAICIVVELKQISVKHNPVFLLNHDDIDQREVLLQLAHWPDDNCNSSQLISRF
jgi:hypothetical protein